MASYSYPGSQMFPQPQGSVYVLNNSMEFANVPIGGNLSVGICPTENLMCIKVLTNGTPSFVMYKLSPCEMKTDKIPDEFSEKISGLEKQIEEIKSLLSGGKLKNEL